MKTFRAAEGNKPKIVLSTKVPAYLPPRNVRRGPSTAGGSSNYNMLRFEDKISSEEVYFQAEKDHNTLIKHNETRRVGNNHTTNIHVNDTRYVETGDDTIAVQQGNRTITVKQNITTESQQGNWKLTVDQGSMTEYAQGQISITSPTSITLSCGGSTIKMTPSEITITQGGTTIDLTSGMLTQNSGLIKLNS